MPNQSITDNHKMIDLMKNSIKKPTGVFVAGYFKAREVDKDMPLMNSRGCYILEMVARTELQMLTISNESTLRHHRHRRPYVLLMRILSVKSQFRLVRCRGYCQRLQLVIPLSFLLTPPLHLNVGLSAAILTYAPLSSSV